jgi:SAM-dependent methyltransferase
MPDASGVAYYERSGSGYASRRRPDPRIAAAIADALGDARSVLNVGAGAGSYEPTDRSVVAVEPSAIMAGQRPPGSAPCVRGVAEALPFADGAFDAAMAVLTLHHWTDWRRGIREMLRVARRAVVLTHDPEPPFWLFDYFPAIRAHDLVRMPAVSELAALLGGGVRVVPVPHDCSDGFLGAHWREPSRYLDAAVRSGMSGFALLSEVQLHEGLARLELDLASGAWAERHGALLQVGDLDIGYRLVVAER